MLALLLLAGTAAASAQGAGPPPDGAPTSSTTGPPPASPPPTSAPDLLSRSLPQDISTASYYELVSWCDELGLDDSGSRKDLQARLARHFSVKLPEAPVPGKRAVTVRSARQSEYFTQSESEEKYVLLRGDVVVEVRDTSDGTLQVIKAASLTFNQTRRTISAVGDVTYALTRGGQTDTFTGQSLDFDLDSSEAIFYDGSTRRIIKRTGKDVPFTFAGETITRVSNDTVILQKGAFTSSETPSDPFYQIRASTVWLLAPGEWAVQDAVLLIGRVPILYLPGFFWPGDDFFFNPNIGFRPREGSFLQTTTYLLGRKPKEDTPFSFLQLTGSGDAGYALQPHGLFLRKMPGTQAPKNDGRTLKLLADIYSRLGIMAGLAGDFSPIGTFRASVAASRTIFYDNYHSYTPIYTPYLPVANPPYNAGDEFWNSSSLFGLTVPLRFGLEGSLKTSGSFYSLTAGFQYFSDPSFTTDFYTRSESGMFSALFAQQNAVAVTTPQQVNLSWDVTSRLDFTKMVNLPFVQNLSIPNLNLNMTWQSKTPDPSLYPQSLLDPQFSDPGHAFYYPSSITVPNVSFAVSGDIVTLGGTRPAAAAPPANVTSPGGTPAGGTAAGGTASTAPPPNVTSPGAPASTPSAATTPPISTTQSGPTSPAVPAIPPVPATPSPTAPDPGKGFRAPVPTGAAPVPTKEAPPRIPFRSPEPQPNEPQQGAGQGSTFKLSYQVQPRATFQQTFDSTLWNSPHSIDYVPKYQTFETGGTTSIVASSSFLDRLADTSLTLTVDGLWRSRFGPSATELASTDWANQLLSDQQQDRLSIRTAFQGTVRPFPVMQELSTSTLQYRINARMYQIGLTGTDPFNPVTTTLGPSWTPDAISEHSLASNLALATPATNDSLAVTLQLPPLVPTMIARLDAAGGALKGRVQGGFAAPPTGILPQPLVVNAAVDFTPGFPFSASEELQFDLGGSVLTRATSQLGFAGLAGTFVAQNTGSPNQLVPGTLRLGYEAAADPLWYWRDRVKLVPGLKTHWYLNLQNYIDNLFDFSPSLTLTVYKNLDFTFSSVSNNTRTYLYIPGWSGFPWVSPLTDLLRSFNFANNDDRRRSGFKIQTLSLKVVQHFPDWDVSVQYQGSPQLMTINGSTAQQYQWSPTFAIQVQWNAISEVKSNIHQDYTGTATVPSLR